MTVPALRRPFVALFAAALFASPVYAAETDLDSALRAVIENQSLTGEPQLKLPPVDIKSPLAQLGKRLFFTTVLGGKADTACVSCHHPMLGGGDNLPLSIGVDAVDPKVIGPGRKHSPKGFDFDGGPTVPRNAQSTFNTIFYSHCMFWDCRIEAIGASPGMNGRDASVIRTPDTMWGMPRVRASTLLEAQAAFPVTSEDEMRAKFMEDDNNNDMRESLAKRLLLEQEKWLGDFQQAFNSDAPAQQVITFEHVTKALATYEASQVFIDNPWRAYLQGRSNALSDSAKRGALLFLRDKNDGGYGCAGCHRGDFFTDEAFHVLAIPQIGRGKDDGALKDHDYGRFVQSGNAEDKFAFRTPTLLNVEVTGPYGHSGAYAELRDMIRHMINPELALAGYDFELTKLDPTIQKARARENTREALEQFQQLQKDGKSQLTPGDVVESDVDALHAFLLSLTDPCVKSQTCLADWLQ